MLLLLPEYFFVQSIHTFTEVLLLLPLVHISFACAAARTLLHLALFDICGPSSQCAAARRRHRQEAAPFRSRDPCVCSWDYITTPERGLPDRHAQCNTSRGKASELGSEPPGFRDSRGVAPSSPLSCYVLTQMGQVNRSGVKPCGRPILMEQKPGPQWIRLMPACGGREGAGVSARPSPTGVDGLGLCR